jgi:hypothetical protein
MEGHVKTLAILHIVFGGFGLLLAVGLLMMFGGIAGLIGAGDLSDSGHVPAVLMGGIGILVFGFLLVLSLPGIIAGIGLLDFRPWARVLAIVLSVLDLIHVPFGTALGVYGLWVLLSPDGERLFRRA